jgi:hypothetical protein
MNAAFGNESAAGAGDPELDVCHSGFGVGVGVAVGVGVGTTAFVAVQPAGKAGAVTPSKFSWNAGDETGIGFGSKAAAAGSLPPTLLWRNKASSREAPGVVLLISARPAGSKRAVDSSKQTRVMGINVIRIFIRPQGIIDRRCP